MIVLFSAQLESSEKPVILGLFNSQEEFDAKAPSIFEKMFDEIYAWAAKANYADYYSCANKEKFVTEIMYTLNKCNEAANPNEYDNYFYKENHEVK